MDGQSNRVKALNRIYVAWFVGTVLFVLYGLTTGPKVETMAGAAIVALAQGAWYAWAMTAEHNALRAACHEVMDAARDVCDPWAVQKALMLASDQRIPSAPRLHNGVVLYAALKMEEMAETLLALSDALAHASPGLQPGVPAVAAEFYTKSRMLKESSLHVRAALTSLTIDAPMREQDAVELFDGTTDETVVNCGFALSCGFPGAAGYMEVGSSNLSKRNPETGMIDKDGGGKWIKGPRFFKPDLARVLAQSRA